MIKNTPWTSLLSYIPAVPPLTSEFLPLGTTSNRNIIVEQRPGPLWHKEQKLRSHKTRKSQSKKKNNFEQKSHVT